MFIDDAGTAEILCFDIVNTAHFNYRFILCYRAPSFGVNNVTAFLNTLKQFESLSNSNAVTILLGDFNLPGVQWQSLTTSNAGGQEEICEERFLNFVLDYNFKPNVFEATREQNILDQVLCNDPFAVFNTEVVMPFSSSDHNSVTFDVLLHVPIITDSNVSSYNFPDFNFNNADWTKINEALSLVDWYDILNNHDCNDQWTLLCRTLEDVIAQHVPLKTARASNFRTKQPHSIRKLLNKKCLAWRLWKKVNTTESKNKYKTAASNYRAAVLKHKYEYEQKIVSSGNLGKFYSYANEKFTAEWCRRTQI